MVTRRLLGLQTLMLVYNDAVPALLSGTEGRLEGCVLIAGTGKSSSFVALLYACLAACHNVEVICAPQKLPVVAWQNSTCKQDSCIIHN